ncbi:MAG: hypothetical protein QM629_10910 [Parafilimonas sp.]
MELTLKNYKTGLPKTLLKHAEKNIVRECDETKAGHYVAYVDEGDDSFDVSLTLSKDGTITAHSCDCKNGRQFCSHATALLLSIISGKKSSPAVKGKKKISPAELLLDDAPPDKLKNWVKDLLAVNKDIALAFIHHFSPKKHSYTIKEVEQVTVEAARSVIKKKKNIDLTEVKNVLSLWKQVHAPVTEAYGANTGDEDLFLNFHALMEACLNLIATFKFPGTKPVKYVEEILQQQVENINNLYSEEVWEKATGYFINHLINEKRTVRMHYLIHLKNIITIAGEPRRKKLADRLIKQYAQYNPEHPVNGTAYTETLFGIAETFNYSNEYLTVFKPVRFNNAYNEKLINLLIQNKQYRLAEKYAIQQTEGNYREDYNIPYFLLLKKIYKEQPDEAKLADVLYALFPHTFDFEDYLFITSRMNEEEKKKWRTKMLAKARHNSGYNKAAMEFAFRLSDHEKKHKKMIEYIDSYTPYTIILRYFEPMALVDKNGLLKKIFDRGNSYSRYDEENDEQHFIALYALMLKHYPKNFLQAAVKQRESDPWFFRRNDFAEYIKNELQAEK